MAYARAYMIKKGASVEIDEVEFNAQIWKVLLVPETPTQTKRTFGGVDKDRDSTAWTVEISMYSSRGTGSLAAAIATAIAADDNMELVLQLKPGTGQEVVTFTFVPVPLGYGGEVGEWNETEATFEVIDEPIWTTSS
jgi:homoserine kinase